MFLEEEICMLANIHVEGLSGFYNDNSQVYYNEKIKIHIVARSS